MAAFHHPYSGSKGNYSGDKGYKIVKKLGEGGFGVTYLVTKDSRDYALKQLKRTSLAEAQEALKEISILRRMNHVNVVEYHSSFLDESQNACIVMEYCKHGDLCDLINKGNDRASAEDFIIAAMHQICSGLNYVHSQMVIHRDIKPTNIFVHKSATLKIGDFGCSKTIKSGVSVPSWYVIGTDGYMAPEILSEKIYSFKSDMFAAGRVLFDLCIRRQPAWNPHNPSISNRYSNGLQCLLQMLTAKDPSKRISASDAIGMLSKMDPTKQTEDGISLPLAELSLSRQSGQRQYTSGASRTRFVNIDQLLRTTLTEMVPSLSSYRSYYDEEDYYDEDEY